MLRQQRQKLENLVHVFQLFEHGDPSHDGEAQELENLKLQLSLVVNANKKTLFQEL